MAINTLETAALFQQQLDKQMTQEATSGWMEGNAGQVKYTGGKEIKIPKLTMDGLADYDRDNGYVQGAVTQEYETKTMTQDRAVNSSSTQWTSTRPLLFPTRPM
jgi:hypothetical protein